MMKPEETACCEFDETQSRRNALRMAFGAAAGLAVVSTFGNAFVETAYASTGKADRMLVVLSMRGAADGLSLVVPHADPIYYQARPGIAVPKSSLLRGDSFFGLHPAFQPLLPLWDAGRIAAIQATGQIVTTRSHFAAMEEVEDADPGSNARVGWLNRLLSLRSGTPSWLNGVQLGDTVLATQLAGPSGAVSAPNLESLKLAGPDSGPDAAAWEKALTTLWGQASGSVGVGGKQAISVAKAFSPARNAADGTVTYPAGDLAAALKATAKVLKSDVGAEIITVDQGSWDHHQWVGNLQDGNVKRMAEPFAASLAAFFKDLGSLADKVTVVTISEFGRRVKENANGGLDHGHGNVMFVMGAGVKGGYYGRWPGLQNTVDADLPVTTDYRDVLAEVVGKLYPERSLSVVFPQLAHSPVGFMEGSAVVPPVSPEPEPEPTPPVTPALKKMPTSFFKSWGKQSGKAKVGAKVTAPLAVLNSSGKKAGVKASYQWELVKSGKISKKATTRSTKVASSYVGRSLQVRVTFKAKGYHPMVKLYKFGAVKKK